MSRGTEETTGKGDAPKEQWLLVRSTAAVWGRFRAQQRTLPAAARKRFWRRMGGGVLIAAAVTAGVTYLGKWAAPWGLDAWDEATLRRLVEEVPLLTYYDATLFESPATWR